MTFPPLGSSWTPPSQSVWSPAGFPRNVAKHHSRLSNALRVSGGATVAKPTDDNRLDGVGRALLVAVSVSRAKMVGFFGVDAVQEVKCQPSLRACLRGVRVLRACAQSSFMGFGVINATALLVLVVRVLCKTS